MKVEKDRRYIGSAGLAFAEKKEMNKLSKLAEKGWILDSFAFLGYSLRKDEPQKLIYAVDYHDVAKGDQDEYYQMFEAGGWNPVCSKANIHIFSAKPGTKPIYSDQNTAVEKYRRVNKVIGNLSIALALLTVILFFVWQLFGNSQASPAVSNTLYIGFVLSMALTLPSIMTCIAFRFRLKGVRKYK